MWVLNECQVVDCSGRPDQPHKMPGCRVVALFWVRPSHHEQRNGEQQVGNSRDWDAQFVEITWCQAADCLVHQKAKFEQDALPSAQPVLSYVSGENLLSFFI